MDSDILILAMTPQMHRGHLIALLRNVMHSEFSDEADYDIVSITDRLVIEAQNSFGPFDTFAHGPLTGQLVSSVFARQQAIHLAPKLVIPGLDSQAVLEHNQHPFVDRIFSSFILSAEVRKEIMEAVDICGGNPVTAKTFVETYYGLPAVVLIE